MVWVGVRIRVGVSVRVRVMVRALIKCAFARRAAHLVKCAICQMRPTNKPQYGQVIIFVVLRILSCLSDYSTQSGCCAKQGSMVGWLGFNGTFSTKLQKCRKKADCPPSQEYHPRLCHSGLSPWPRHSLPPQISLPQYACV